MTHRTATGRARGARGRAGDVLSGGCAGGGPATPGAARGRGVRTGGFTLIELLLAIAISAVILAAATGVLFGALRLRNRTARLLDDAATRQQVLGILRRDLAGMVAPGTNDTAMADAPIYGSMNGLSDPTGSGMQIFTASGVVSDSAPWGSLQRVAYVLRDPTNNAAPAIGRDLWRIVTRNLLPQGAEIFEEQLLLSDVERFELTFWDGASWRPTWTGTNELVALPRAVNVSLVVAEAEPSERSRGMLARRTLVPFQLVVPVMVTPSTNTTDTATADTGTGGGR